MFENAIVRPPSENFAKGLTSADLGQPIYAKALEQHHRYCEALLQCGLRLTRLEADPFYPDSTFVEDTAVLTDTCATLARPGATSRAGEVAGILGAIAQFYSSLKTITPPGTLEGGDVCQAGRHFFIGISQRTNEEGACQLAEILSEEGYPSTLVDIRGVQGMLHLKSGLACLGDNRLVLTDAFAEREEFRGFEIVRVHPIEGYAANCIRVNHQVLIASGYPALEESLGSLGYSLIALEMSEFQKMDGGLSCLSLRW